MNTKTYDKIVVFGSVAYDELMNFPGAFSESLQLEHLDKVNVAFQVNKLTKELGGTATNIAYNLSLVSKLPVYIVSGVGKDGGEFMEFFKKNNINTEGIVIDNEQYTATGKATTDRNNNQIWSFYYGACDAVKDMDISKIVTKDSLCIVAANHVDAFAHIQEQLIKIGCDFVYDPTRMIGVLPNEKIIEGLHACRWLVGNEYEINLITRMTGVSAEQLVNEEKGVIMTMSEKGVNYKEGSTNIIVAAYTKGHIVDPTGAGDAWIAGFIASYVSHKELAECLKLANALASFAVEKNGAVYHRPSQTEIQSRADSIS